MSIAVEDDSGALVVDRDTTEAIDVALGPVNDVEYGVVMVSDDRPTVEELEEEAAIDVSDVASKELDDDRWSEASGAELVVSRAETLVDDPLETSVAIGQMLEVELNDEMSSIGSELVDDEDSQ